MNLFDSWKAFAVAMVFLALGLYAGYSINLDKTATSQAIGMCSVCQENLNTMIYNFNVMTKQCGMQNPYAKANFTLLNGTIIR